MKKIGKDYCLEKLLGKGSFGEVYLTSKVNSNFLFATKVMQKEKVEEPNYLKYFLNEINILKDIDHKNCIKLESLQKTVHNYYIIMEYCNGDTLQNNYEKYKLKYGKPFSEKISQYVLKQIIDAVNYLHSKKIVHRDLKSGNMMLNYRTKEAKDNLDVLNSDLKIIDFGTSAYKNKITNQEHDNFLKTVIGSPLNMDPIILKMYVGESSGAVPYDEKIDIWSLGILSYYLLTGCLPFKATNTYDLSKEIEKGEIKISIDLSLETISLLINMLQFSPVKRTSAKELLNHPFIQKSCDNFTYLNKNNISNNISKYIKNGYLYINIKDNDNLCSLINQHLSKDSNITNFSSQSELQWGFASTPIKKFNIDGLIQKKEKKEKIESKEKTEKKDDDNVNTQEIKKSKENIDINKDSINENININNDCKIKNIDINEDNINENINLTKDKIENKSKNNDIINEKNDTIINNNNINNDNTDKNKNTSINSNMNNENLYKNYLFNSSPFETLNTNFDFLEYQENKKMSMADLSLNNQINNSVAGYSYEENIEKINPNQGSISKSLITNNNINYNNLSQFNNASNNIISENQSHEKLFSFSDENATAKFNSFHVQTNDINNNYHLNIDIGSKNNTFYKSSNNEILNKNINIYSSMP